MSFKKIGRIACVSALACIAGATAAFSACTIETKHPRAKITIEFNEKTYEIEYQLYRNMYPQTVKHFIQLADEGFYDNTIIHNYTTNDWYGGGFKYSAEDYTSAYATTGTLKEYFLENSLEEAYYNLFTEEKLTPSVYKSAEFDDNGKAKGTDALPTLIGEFANNDHTVEKGALTSAFGALKMYYTSGKTYGGEKTSKDKVWVENTTDHFAFERDYALNSATSLFTIQAGTSSALTDSAYCTFGILKDGSGDVLNDLKDAISTYISDNLGGTSSSFYKSVEVTVDKYEQFADKGTDVTYRASVLPIVIKTVKITKY